MDNIYLIISIVILVLIVIFFLVSRAKGEQPRTPSRLVTFGMFFVILGIVFSNSGRLISYSFMGVGVILSVIDLIRYLRK